MAWSSKTSGAKVRLSWFVENNGGRRPSMTIARTGTLSLNTASTVPRSFLHAMQTRIRGEKGAIASLSYFQDFQPLPPLNGKMVKLNEHQSKQNPSHNRLDTQTQVTRSNLRSIPPISLQSTFLFFEGMFSNVQNLEVA